MRSDLRAAALVLLGCAALCLATARRAAPPLAAVSPPPRRVLLNRATASELAALPGLGEERARRIVARRRELGGFRSLDELLAVPGLGPKTLDKLRPALLVDDAAGAGRP
jgi:competence protein ComEA